MDIVLGEVELHVGRGWATSENSLVRFVNRNDANGYYKTLGLSPGASREQIKAAYLRLVRALHPDYGGDEESFRFVVEVAKVLLDAESKSRYDSVEADSMYVGDMEREELARSGVLISFVPRVSKRRFWSCLTSSGRLPGEDTDAWIDLCRQVSPAVGYRGKLRVGVIERGRHWPCDPNSPWGLLDFDQYTFVIFQRGVEPNRLYALCAMMVWHQHLLRQNVRGLPAQEGREHTCLCVREDSLESIK